MKMLASDKRKRSTPPFSKTLKSIGRSNVWFFSLRDEKEEKS